MFEERIHLLKWSPRSFGHEQPEEDGIGKVADDEDQVELPSDIGHSDWCDLALRRLLASQRPCYWAQLTIMVLKANEAMHAIDTPFDRVLVSKTSAGMIHESGPQVHEKEKLTVVRLAIWILTTAEAATHKARSL